LSQINADDTDIYLRHQCHLRQSAVLTLLFVFLIPWQARWISSIGKINGREWEYGTQSLYATEILLGVILVAVIAKFMWEFYFYSWPGPGFPYFGPSIKIPVDPELGYK